MNLTLLSEPMLEFADGGRHLDPRFGVLRYGPLDASASREPRLIQVGMVGTNETIETMRSWRERCGNPIPGRSTRLRNLFSDCPGFAGDSMFQAALSFATPTNRTIG